MKKNWKKLTAVAVSCVMASSMAIGLAACGGDKPTPTDRWYDTNGGWRDTKDYTYFDYTSQVPSMWNDLASVDGADRDITQFISSSFFSFDFKFDSDGEIVPGEFEVVPDAATKLEDVTADYKGQYGIPADDKVGHRAWKYTLRSDLKWDDGTPIKAGDFVYSMEKQLNGKYKFEQAANQWNGNYVLHNAKNYFYSDVTDWYPATEPYGMGYNSDLDSKLIFSWKNADETKELYNGVVSYFRSWVTKTYGKITGEVLAKNLKSVLNIDVTAEAANALEGKTLAEIKADATLNATWETILGAWKTDPGEELHFFVTEYTWAHVDADEIGIFAPSDTELVVVYDNANLAPIDEEGNYTYQAAYYFQDLPLVKRDLWEKLEVPPTGGSSVYTTNYNALSVENSASWGPYKLTSYQADTAYTLSRNDKWHGYGLEQNDDKYQTDTIKVRKLSEWNTAWQMFQKGQLTTCGIDSDIADEYRNSSRAVYTPTSGVSTYFLQCNEDALTKEKGNALLKYKEFREAFSLALDRSAWCKELTTSYQPALGVYNDLIYYDVANGGVYRYTESAKEVLLKTYGAEKQSNGNWKVGNKEYSDIDDAIDALTGYNLDKAKQLFQEAYDKALEAGDIDANGTVTLRYGSDTESESLKKEIKFLNDMFAKATEGTSLAGKVKVEFFEFNAANWIEDFRSGGMFDICSAYVSGGAWNPYYSLQIYLLDAQRLTLGWDTSSEMLELTVPGGDGKPEIHDTLSLVEWFNCVNGLGGKYDISLYPESSRLLVVAALEGAILQSYTSLPVGSRTGSSLLSYRCEYITYEYNTFKGFGGIEYLAYRYDDTEWDEYVKSQGGTLDYRN